jgi:MOSC domain-containing protein YiiM
MNAKVHSIHIAPTGEAKLDTVPEVRAVAGRGLEGDRYFNVSGTYSKHDGPDREVTLIEIEALEGLRNEYGIDLAPEETRRNIVTRGVALNHLVGREFQVGEAVFRGIRLCEPCGHLEKMCGKPARAGLVHRGGLRAQIVRDGMVRSGDPITAA